VAILHSLSGNYNGRKLKDGKYYGGAAKIRIHQFPDPTAAQEPAEAGKS
jgi:hypothetical protein